MIHKNLILVMLTLGCLLASVTAGSAGERRICDDYCNFKLPLCISTCPDDYCGKPGPAVRCPPKLLCDDYCGKPAPCARECSPRTLCDDYCRKPCPAPKKAKCIPCLPFCK